MNERLAFIKAVCEHPADDTVRLVYADWLEENGEPERAEFIRVQVELSRAPARLLACRCESCGWVVREYDSSIPVLEYTKGAKNIAYGCRDCDRRRNLRHRERELYEGGAAKFGPWPFAPANVQFARGFVSHVTCSADDWLEHADALAWHPSQTRRYRSEDGDSSFEGDKIPVPCPKTAQPIERVTLTGWTGEDREWEAWRELVNCGNFEWKHPRWPGIVFLQFMGLTEEAFEALTTRQVPTSGTNL